MHWRMAQRIEEVPDVQESTGNKLMIIINLFYDEFHDQKCILYHEGQNLQPTDLCF